MSKRQAPCMRFEVLNLSNQRGIQMSLLNPLKIYWFIYLCVRVWEFNFHPHSAKNMNIMILKIVIIKNKKLLFSSENKILLW